MDPTLHPDCERALKGAGGSGPVVHAVGSCTLRACTLALPASKLSHLTPEALNILTSGRLLTDPGPVRDLGSHLFQSFPPGLVPGPGNLCLL